MDNKLAEALKKLVALSEIDARLAGIAAEKKTLAAKRKEKKEVRDAAKKDSDRKNLEYEDRRAVYNREEKRLKEAQQKLVERRKALTTLGSYKLQVAAEREIEAAGKQLGVQEEQLIRMLEQIEELESVAAESKAIFDKAEAELAAADKEISETAENLDRRASEYIAERNVLLPQVEQPILEVYQRALQRYPVDPIVPFSKGACGGCFIELGPQTAVEIARATKPVRCRGCGRILYLQDAE